MCSVCFGFGMQVLQGWVPNLVCVYIWYVGIVGFGPMSNVDLNNWHVDIASVRFIFLMLLLVWHVSIANVNSMHSVLIM
jgi:hypothetical protein